MTDPDPKTPGTDPRLPPSSSSHKLPNGTSAEPGFPGGIKYPNPPETSNPDPITLREQWKFATRQYSRWYAHAWGTAIVAGLSFFALGWFIKGQNPLESFRTGSSSEGDKGNSDHDVKKGS